VKEKAGDARERDKMRGFRGDDINKQVLLAFAASLIHDFNF